MEQDKSLREERKRHKAAKLKVVWTTHHKRERDDDDDAGPKNLSKKNWIWSNKVFQIDFSELSKFILSTYVRCLKITQKASFDNILSIIWFVKCLNFRAKYLQKVYKILTRPALNFWNL